VARMGSGEVFTGFWLESPKARDHWEDVSNWIQLAQDRVRWRAFVNTVISLRVS
jgi:hypothetical protein